MEVNLGDLCCVKADCGDAGKRGSGNLRFVRWIGKDKSIRFVRCTTCRSNFSERKGTPLFGSKLSQTEVEEIARHLMEGNGQRKTARLTKHRQGTVSRWIRRLGLHAQSLHDEVSQNLDVREAQVDEKWSLVGKKRG